MNNHYLFFDIMINIIHYPDSFNIKNRSKECAFGTFSRRARLRKQHFPCTRSCASAGGFLCHRTKFPVTQKKIRMTQPGKCRIIHILLIIICCLFSVFYPIEFKTRKRVLRAEFRSASADIFGSESLRSPFYSTSCSAARFSSPVRIFTTRFTP